MSFPAANSLALVTGASRGIGVALVNALLSSGWRVDVLARSEAKLRATYADHIQSGRVRTLIADITDAAAVESVIGANYRNGEAPDLLFNNAGRFASMAPIWDSDLTDWWADVRVNILGCYVVTRTVLPLMLRRNHGVIVNMGGGRPGGGSGYAVSKAGVAEFTRALSAELRQVKSGVSAFLADPGLVDTEMTRPHAKSTVAATWVPELVDRMSRGDTRRPEEIAGKLLAQLPHMGPATSGGFFNPDTPTGSFGPIP
jgi:NAD(P)-dependent dehydrogenase (short-subunit alcohol dehydrogenase family)